MARSSAALNPRLRKLGKKQKWLPAFSSFIRALRIQSKEAVSIDDDRGGSELDLWQSQQMFLECLCEGLEDGVHEFFFLKSRGLGITTIGMTIILFWAALHPGMIGCLVSDNDGNREGFREIIRSIMKSFPEDFVGSEFTVVTNNKYLIKFSNGAQLDLLVAGQHKENWSEGKHYTFGWLTEVSKYGSKIGINNFIPSMAQVSEQRLFIWESTANGFANHWHDIWVAAGDDHFTKRRRFIGWWAKPANRIEPKDRRYAVYARSGPNGEEAELISQVAEQYGHVVTLEQLAWYRWKQADKSQEEGALDQNEPWTEQQAFVTTGSSFFQMRRVQAKYDELLERQEPYRGYRFIIGDNIFETRMEQITDPAQIDEVELRLWEDPIPEAQYVIGCDPAYGRTDWADRHAISIWRCYADRLVQVAEYADEKVETHHCAWVLAYLGGAYRQCMINLELGGPGRAILREFETLKEIMKAEVYARRVRDLDWEDFLDMARWYLYHRPDSPGPGYAISWETTWRSKMEIMNQIRDSFTTGMLDVHSIPLLDEMSTMVQTKSEIAPEGAGRNKDDRVFAAALANRAWIDWIRGPMLSEGATYEIITASEQGELSVTQQMVKRIVYDFWRGAEERAQAPETPTWLHDRGFV